MEIERKFLLKQLPPIQAEEEIEILQGYVSTNPEVRIRSYHVVRGKSAGHKDYKLTVKDDGDLVRDEIETYITEEFFEQLVEFIGRPLIHKHYTRYKHGGHVIECSIVDDGAKTSFIYGEVEFGSVNEAKEYQWPFDDAEDVTYDSQYKMKNYWLANA